MSDAPVMNKENQNEASPAPQLEGPTPEQTMEEFDSQPMLPEQESQLEEADYGESGAESDYDEYDGDGTQLFEVEEYPPLPAEPEPKRRKRMHEKGPPEIIERAHSTATQKPEKEEFVSELINYVL